MQALKLLVVTAPHRGAARFTHAYEHKDGRGSNREKDCSAHNQGGGRNGWTLREAVGACVKAVANAHPLRAQLSPS